MEGPRSAEAKSLTCPLSDDNVSRRSSARDAQIPGNESAATQSEENAAGQASDAGPLESVGRAADYWTRLDKLIGSLEDRVKKISEAQNDQDSDSESSEADSDSGPDEAKQKNKWFSSFVPEVRYCNYHQFVNHYPDDGEHSYAIEVLRSGSKLGKDIIDEWELRCAIKVRGYVDSYTGRSRSRRHGGIMEDDEDKWIQKVRIQSPALIKVLGNVTNHPWGTKPHTFSRPFRYMIYFHGRFKERLAQMEEEAERGEGSRETLEEMRCYIKFAEEEIIPEYNKFANHDHDNSAKIRFQDLWYLFRPGELIYIPQETVAKSFSPEEFRSRTFVGNQRPEDLQTVWKLFYAWPKHRRHAPIEEYNDSGSDSSSDSGSDSDSDLNDSQEILRVSCYYYDHDGSTYTAVLYKHAFNIPWFDGKKDIRDLEVYPIRFAREWRNVLADGRLWGKKFIEYIEMRHVLYSGWTRTQQPSGYSIFSQRLDGHMRTPEHIESDIMIDFQEVFNNRPGWKLNFLDDDPISGNGGHDPLFNDGDRIIVWKDARRTAQVMTIAEVLITEDNIHTLEHDDVLVKDQFTRAKTRTSMPKPEGDELALLPSRLFAYAIRDRKFICVHLRHIKPADKESDILDRLEIRPDYKRHILALVRSNFGNKEMDEEGLLGTQDLIRGKGKGVVILLHGAPGVGKTATAEAVAHKFGRPLFPITCGDLGFSPDTVEKKLNEIFRLAHLWNCVLLLDEADVFLTARHPTDIKRNALVSVFLRILEYYNGVLFLTTNRVGKLDPAITSRVHLILHYRRLQSDQFLNVFRLNIEKLEQIEQQRAELFSERKLYILKDEILQFASDHFQATGDGRESWNGRQIRNAFLIASSLARYEAEAHGAEFQPQLRASHFKEVETVTKEFDSFRKHLKGGDDEEVARRKEERDDTWEEAESRMGQPSQGFQHGVKTYHSPAAQSTIPHGYPPAPGDPSPHSTPGRSYAPSSQYSARAPGRLSPGPPLNVPAGYPPDPREPSSHTAPGRSYAPGPQYSAPAAPANLTPEYGTGHRAAPADPSFVPQSRS